MGIRQPGVEGEHRDFDGKGKGKSQKKPDLYMGVQDELVIVENIQRIDAHGLVIDGVEEQDGNEHQQASHHGEEDKLQSGIDAARPSPDSDQKIHRKEHRLPEDVEKEQVEGDKDAEYSCLEEEHENQILFDPSFDVAPGGKKGDGHQEGCQQDKKEAYAVDSNMVLNAVAEPGSLLHKLRVGRLTIEVEIKHQGNKKNYDGDAERNEAKQVFFLFGDKD